MTTPADAVLSDQVLDRLRASAALVVAVPQMAVKLRVGGEICLEVRRSPLPDATHRVLPPCAFHRAVTRAHQMRRTGEQIAMRGVPAGCEPAIDWGIAACGKILTGGIIRIAQDESWWHAVPVIGDDQHLTEALATAPHLVARHDQALGVALVQATSPRGDKAASLAMIDDLLDTVARVGVADLEQRVTGRLPSRSEQRMDPSLAGTAAPPPVEVGTSVWVAGCPGCGTVDLHSSWPRPELVHPRHWRCSGCLSATWEPVPLRLPT